MTTANLTSSDLRLRDAVMRQLAWDPEVDVSAVGVTAANGSVTLTGSIDTYAGKLAAERAAKRVLGVRAVANDIDVRLRAERGDPEIALDAARALRLLSTIPDGVQAAVHSGRVTLTGKVHWLFQKQSAERAMRHIRGVRNVINYISVSPGTVARDVRNRLVTALHQSADLDARHIQVTVAGDTVTLTGTVGTWLQRDAAERAAAQATGIAHVENQIVVHPIRELSDDLDEIC